MGTSPQKTGEGSAGLKPSNNGSPPWKENFPREEQAVLQEALEASRAVYTFKYRDKDDGQMKLSLGLEAPIHHYVLEHYKAREENYHPKENREMARVHLLESFSNQPQWGG